MNVGLNKNDILSVEVAVLLTDLRCGRVNIYCSQIIKLIVVKLLNDISVSIKICYTNRNSGAVFLIGYQCIMITQRTGDDYGE